VAKAERCNERAISLDVLALQIVQQTTTLADQHEQATLCVKVVLVLSHMIGQMLDTLGQ
jgi:hypothetical protein